MANANLQLLIPLKEFIENGGGVFIGQVTLTDATASDEIPTGYNNVVFQMGSVDTLASTSQKPIAVYQGTTAGTIIAKACTGTTGSTIVNLFALCSAEHKLS